MTQGWQETPAGDGDLGGALLPGATTGSPLPHGRGVLSSTKPGRAPRCAWTLERVSRAHVLPRAAGCWLPGCAELRARVPNWQRHRGPPELPDTKGHAVGGLVGSTGARGKVSLPSCSEKMPPLP